MRGEVYPALFEVDSGGVKRCTPDRVASPGDIAREWAPHGDDLTVAGAALGKHRAALDEVIGERLCVAPETVWVPDGRSLLDAAWAAEGASCIRAVSGLDRMEAYRLAHPGVLLPVYTRLSDAEEAERRALGKAATPRSGVIGPGAGER